ncbi:hypothetical protein KQ313_04200 [Synechococcus sp. CS-1325]|uniref:hypothetical protein n=1 Tax=unclassified Synechococcus TaxID=2626047 RepID=UPI0021A3292A|nr:MULTISPECIES: hypothetical protein [unclassified Synechococcus]MCT0198882.1 hypothetical protein [Synechococcus sp. CS-1325]MCT0213114.1 hypothetical protein [Synechococcus sp. CS-1326]MCT0232932.1 hypothetical protein [Synechococcus sp. CS-1327]
MASPSPPPHDDHAEQRAAINQALQRINARLELRPSNLKSPWLPLADAAQALNFRSSRVLRAAINRGHIPPQFIRSRTGPSGKRRTFYVNAEEYTPHLSNK